MSLSDKLASASSHVGTVNEKSRKVPLNFGQNELNFLRGLLQKETVTIDSPKEAFVANLVKDNIKEAIENAISKGGYYS